MCAAVVICLSLIFPFGLQIRQFALERVREWHDPLPSLVLRTESAPRCRPFYDHDPARLASLATPAAVQRLAAGRALLLGDAAHSMSPLQGQVCVWRCCL
jgi:2-polyprenyl-6-methoxyphenol hydroxylase-like FAD-dependent oxidoreductase